MVHELGLYERNSNGFVRLLVRMQVQKVEFDEPDDEEAMLVKKVCEF
jgi:hypothetical protein